jgi:hypothetical protein
MVLDAVSNFVRGNTDASVDSTQTTVSVADATIFPDPATDGEYNVVIWDVDSHPRPDQDPNVEILRVTAIDTTNDDLTVTRGQETTAGASHPSGSAVHLSPPAKMFGDIEGTFNEFYDDGAQELTADVNNGSVNTQEADITNETLVVANGDQIVSGISANTSKSPSFGDVKKDELGEFSSDTFTPSETGFYWIFATSRIDSQPADQDALASRLQDVTNSTTIVGTPWFAASGTGVNQAFPPITSLVELTAGVDYKYQVENRDSSFDIGANGAHLSIRRAFR